MKKRKHLHRHRYRKPAMTPSLLRTMAKAMLPFFKAVATNQRYAAQWSKAVVQANLDRMQRLLQQVSPVAAKQGLSCNAIGYYVSFSTPRSFYEYTCGTAIPPGTVQFTFETPIHRAIARSLLPLYRQLATNRCFCRALAKAIQLQARPVILRMIRSLVKTPALQSIQIEYGGIALSFRYASSKYTYRHQLFVDRG